MSARGDEAGPGDARRRFSSATVLALCCVAAACGPRRVSLPTDAGIPLQNVSQIHGEVSTACRGVRTLTGEFSLSGHAGSQRLRGRVIAGFERPASMRLVAVAPFGPPGFILAAHDETALLLLPRDDRVVRDESAEAILGALTGVSLAPSDLHAVLTGCVVAAPAPVGGRLHEGGWASIDLGDDAVLYLQRRGGWQLRAARRAGWRIDYLEWLGRFPRVVRLQSIGLAVDVELTVTMAQLETNMDLDPAAFTVRVPASARDMTLDELRAAGPLGERE